MTPLKLLVIAESSPAFVTPLSRIPPGVELVVSEDAGEISRQAPLADALLFAHGNPRLLNDALPLAGRARWIHSLWAGVEGILTPELRAHPALLTNGRGVFRWPLADWVIAAMLFFAFDLRRIVRQQEEGLWKPFLGATLEGRTLGIVGFGTTGAAIASRARPFGMRIAGYRRRPELFTSSDGLDEKYSHGQLLQMISGSDYLVLATPLTAETRGLIGVAEIAAMKPNAVLLNIGRGPVVNEGALIDALRAQKIRGAALDVFDVEPLPQGHPFWAMTNVLLSPHTADRVEGFLGPAFECFLENLSRFQEGKPLANLVDRSAGY
jgi:phosphoglycerate dehydrogenase-like enzyme